MSLLAEFDSPHAMLEAVRELRARGYDRLDTFSPFPVDGSDEALGVRRSRIPAFALAAGLTAAGLAYALQWALGAVVYPLNVGGRPLHSGPAYVPITFEMAILFASLTTVASLLAFTRLPRLWHPLFEVEGFERATVDRCFVLVEAADPRYEVRSTTAELIQLGALRVAPVGREAPR